MTYLERIMLYPKCDFHCHSARGASLKTLSLKSNFPIKQKCSFNSIDDMDNWYRNNVNSLFTGSEGYETLIQATIEDAISDNIVFLILSFSVDRIGLYDNSPDMFIKRISFLINNYPQISIVPELAIPRVPNITTHLANAFTLLEYEFFKSIDLVGNEEAIPPSVFINLYRKAKTQGLRLRAHVGEFGTANSVIEYCHILHLDEIQHGIQVVTSNNAIDYIRRNHILLNVCPTSNIKLNLVDAYSNHPIRRLYDSGVDLTINTDDRTVFGCSVSEEYNNLYTHKVFSEAELESIRMNSFIFCTSYYGFC